MPRNNNHPTSPPPDSQLSPLAKPSMPVPAGKRQVILDYYGEVMLTAVQASRIPEEYPVLTQMECELLKYLANGLSPEQAALRMKRKIRTIRYHLTKLQSKFNTCSRDQLMARAGYLRLCDPYQEILPFDRQEK